MPALRFALASFCLAACAGQAPVAPPAAAVATTATAINYGTPAAPPPFTRATSVAADAAKWPGLAALAGELERARAVLAKVKPAAYFLAYRAHDMRELTIVASDGAIIRKIEDHRRWLDTELRVGDPRFDSARFAPSIPLVPVQLAALPLGDDEAAIAAVAWRETDRLYKAAAERLSQLRAQQAVKVEREDASDDFSLEPPVVRLLPLPPGRPEPGPWPERLRRLSARFAALPECEDEVTLSARRVDRWVVTSEGSLLQVPEGRVTLAIAASVRAADGADLEVSRRRDHFTLPELEASTSDAALDALADEVITTLRALKAAPLAEPYVGPAIFEGGPAAVLFHEALGHRTEGSRLRRDEEDHTLVSKVGLPILPSFISVFDDPGLRTLEGTALVGHYLFDDEGVPAARVSLVEGGVFKGFLLGRTPVKGFAHSNGHGRGQLGRHRESRMANLVVAPSHALPAAELRQRLLAEVARRSLPYGLRVAQLSGGVTPLSRGQSGLRLQLTEVYRVFADGRPDQLLRGADLSGTPLAVLNKIAAASDSYQTFNGSCGANDSGHVPQSNTSPALLVSEVEIIRKAKGMDRPPVLPPPDERSQP